MFGINISIVSHVTGIRITQNPIEVVNKTFSYIVVGGGTAGLAVASRLAENPRISILVIEAGPDAQNDSLVNDPANANVAFPKVYNWFYNTTAQSAGGRILTMAQGKVLGGSSSINSMCWTRGTIDQYDSFERLGNPGWNFTTMLKYMKKSERYNLPNKQQIQLGATVDPRVHGFDGYVNAGFPQPYEGTVAARNFTEALRIAIPGLVENRDVASGIPNGAARFQFSLKPGNDTVARAGGNVRSSSANAYIYPSLQMKPNLVILTGHQATSIVWGTRSNNLSRASGVNFITTPTENVDPGTAFLVRVNREVIVASGTIGSPHFVELSGIGNSSILERVGISVQVNLPAVGTNLQDQALNLFSYSVLPKTPLSDFTVINEPVTPNVAFADIRQILGEMADPAGTDLLHTVLARARAVVSSGAFTSEEGLVKVLTAQARSIVDLQAPVIEYSFVLPGPGTGTINLIFWNLLPQWRGTVHVRSRNPAVHPELNPFYLTGAAFDLHLKGNASRMARKIFAASPLKELAGKELLPGFVTVPENASDPQWQQFVKSTYVPVFHPVGSVPMLPRNDGGAVGPDLVVYGTANVRVVDASVIPIQLSAHLSATVYGIAEKAADMIGDSGP